MTNRNPDQPDDKNLSHLPADMQRARVENARKLEEEVAPPRRDQNQAIEQYLERPRKRRSARTGGAKHPQG